MKKQSIWLFAASILLFSSQFSHAARLIIEKESVWKDNIVVATYTVRPDYEGEVIDYMSLCLADAAKYAQVAKEANITLERIDCVIENEVGLRRKKGYSIIMTRKSSL